MNLSSTDVLLREVEMADERFTDMSMAIYQVSASVLGSQLLSGFRI